MLDELRPLSKQGEAFFQYPLASACESALTSLTRALGTRLVSHYVGRLKKAGNHSTESALRDDLARFQPAALAYLKVTPTPAVPPALKLFSTFVFFDSVKPVPSIKDVAAGGLLKAWVKTIDKTELTLTRQAFRGPSDRRGINWFERAEFLAWVKVVRLCIVCRSVEAMDPRLVWDKVDGDAGWWLSEHVADMIAVLVKQPLFLEIEELQVLRDSILRSLGIDRSLPTRASLDLLVQAAKTWRDGCGAVSSCTVSDLGTRTPWPFDRIDARLSASPGAVAIAGDLPQFHARPAATDRVNLVQDLWLWRRERLLTQRVLTRPDQFRFILVAGSLAHGGRHPPHETHRNGCMFDIDLTTIPDLVKEFGPADFHSPDPPLSVDEEEILLEPDVPADDESLSAPADATLPRTEEWNFPSHKQEREFLAACVAFTECIYLSFPSSVIYASRLITDSAKVKLTRRLEMLRDQTPPEQSDALQLITQIKDVVSRINPAPYDRMPAEKQTLVRRGHRNHWHVSYDADALGDENGVPSSRPDRAQQIASILSTGQLELLARMLWELDPDSDVPE